MRIFGKIFGKEPSLEDYEAARAIVKIYQQQANEARRNMENVRRIAEELTDTGAISESKRYWNELARWKKELETYLKNARGYELAASKIYKEVIEKTMDTSGLKRRVRGALEKIKTKKSRIGSEVDDIERILEELDKAEDVSIYAKDYNVHTNLTEEGEKLLNEYLEKKKARESQLMSQQSELESKLKELECVS